MSNIESADGQFHLHREKSDITTELLALAPIELSELTSIKTEDDYAYQDHMRFSRSKVYPIVLANNETSRNSFQYMALVNHPLQGAQIIHFFNRFVPVKHNGLSSTYSGGRGINENKINYVSNDVAVDWAYMVSPTSSGEEFRKKLEAVHAPANVPGFREFRPHVIYYLNALANDVINDQYEIPTDNCISIVPLLHVEVNGRRQQWHDEVLNTDEVSRLYEAINPLVRIHERTTLDRNTYPDTFAGMAVPAYVKPGLTTWRWSKEQSGQEMSIAQGPVLNWQHKQQHLGVQLMRNLQSYIRESL